MLLRVEIPLRLRSVNQVLSARLRERFAVKKGERQVGWAAVAGASRPAQRAVGAALHRFLPCDIPACNCPNCHANGCLLLPENHAAGLVVTITRVAPRQLDTDNVYAKSIRDGIATALGVDDGDPRVTWRVAQAKGKTYTTIIEIEART